MNTGVLPARLSLVRNAVFSLPRVLQHLQQWHWLDRRTRVLCMEFVVFNANVNLFCAVTLILESSDVGRKAFPLLFLLDLTPFTEMPSGHYIQTPQKSNHASRRLTQCISCRLGCAQLECQLLHLEPEERQ